MRTAGEIVIKGHFLPDAILADLDLVDALSLILLSDEELVKQAGFLGQAGESRGEVAVAELSLDDVTGFQCISENGRLRTSIHLQEVLSSLPNDLLFKRELLIRVIDARHDWRELNIYEAFDLSVRHYIFDLFHRRLTISHAFENLATPL